MLCILAFGMLCLSVSNGVSVCIFVGDEYKREASSVSVVNYIHIVFVFQV